MSYCGEHYLRIPQASLLLATARKKRACSGMSSLIARDVLIPSLRADEPLTMADGVTALLADSALMVVARHGADSRAAIYTPRGSALRVHTQPVEWVHRPERLPEMSIVVDHVLSQIVPHTPADQAIQFTVSASYSARSFID